MTLGDTGILIPAGQILLTASFSYSLVRSLQQEQELSEAFESLLIGLLALIFYRQGATLLSNVSGALSGFFEKKGGGASLISQLIPPMVISHGKESFSLLSSLKDGVWAVLISITQFLFICAEGVFFLAQKIFWQLLLVLLPLAAGVFPVFPRMLQSLALYAVELSLWQPVLYLINLSAGLAAASPEIANAPLGLGVVITQVLAVFLILQVPVVTHRFLNGAFNHLLGAGAPAYQRTRSMALWAAGLARPAPAQAVAKTLVIRNSESGGAS